MPEPYTLVAQVKSNALQSLDCALRQPGVLDAAAPVTDRLALAFEQCMGARRAVAPRPFGALPEQHR